MQHSVGRPTLVFCSTRKGTSDAALGLVADVNKPGSNNPFIKSQEQYERLQRAALTVQDKILQSCIKQGSEYLDSKACKTVSVSFPCQVFYLLLRLRYELCY